MILKVVTWQNVHNHTIETLYGHHYTKNVANSTVLFTRMIIWSEKNSSLVFPLQFTDTCDIHCSVYIVLFAVGQMTAGVAHSRLK